VNEVCATRDEDCIIEDLEDDTETATEHQVSIEVTENVQPAKVIQKDEDSESEEVTAGRNIVTFVAEVHSHNENNIQAASQPNVVENLDPAQPQSSNIAIAVDDHSNDENNVQAASQLDADENLNPLPGQLKSSTFLMNLWKSTR